MEEVDAFLARSLGNLRNGYLMAGKTTAKGDEHGMFIRGKRNSLVPRRPGGRRAVAVAGGAVMRFLTL